ncbi:MAG: hypothetical protein Q9170_005910 [Blastenia crenularia]
MQENPLLNHSFVMRSMHKHSDRYEPYSHPKLLQSPEPRMQDASTYVVQPPSRQQHIDDIVSQPQAVYYFDPPVLPFSNAEEEQSFHDKIAQLRQNKALSPGGASATHGDDLTAHASTITRPQCDAQQPAPSFIHPTRLQLMEEDPAYLSIDELVQEYAPEPQTHTRPVPTKPSGVSTERRGSSGLPWSRGLAQSRDLARPIKQEKNDVPANPNLVPLSLKTSKPVQLPPRPPPPSPTHHSQPLNEMSMQDVQAWIVSLKGKLKIAVEQKDQRKINKLAAEKIRANERYYLMTEERRRIKLIGKQPIPTFPPSLLKGGSQPERPNSPAKDATTPITEFLVQFGALTRKVAGSKGAFSAEMRSAAMDGLGIALVACAEELLAEAERVTGKPRAKERARQEIEAEENIFPSYMEYDTD